jgi:hypothetical protein
VFSLINKEPTMILRAVINAIQHEPFNCWELHLECGHSLRGVRVRQRRPFPRRKRCEACELVQHYATARPQDYAELLERSWDIPADDRPQALLDWVYQCARAEELMNKMPGLDGDIALRLAEEGESYPLPLGDDDWDQPRRRV